LPTNWTIPTSKPLVNIQASINKKRKCVIKNTNNFIFKMYLIWELHR
jgi:hypothetical protein